MGANFMQFAKIQGVTPEDPTIANGGQKLFYYIDPPHLIKATRNMLMSNEFHWDGKKTFWSYIQEFYYDDSQLRTRLAPRLNEQHIHPYNFEKQKVKLAVQVLSSTVAASLNTYIHLEQLPEDALLTVEVISHFDTLFDIFNSSELNVMKEYNCAFKGQDKYVSFLKENYLTVIHENFLF